VKLLLINYEFPPVGGGAANATWFLARELATAGHAVTVLTTAFEALRGTATESGFEVVRVRTGRHRAGSSNPFEMFSFLVAALIPALRLARRRRFDAAIAFFAIPSGPVAALLRIVFGIPYIVSQRGGDVPGGYPEIDAVHRLITPLRRAVLRRATAIVANSPSLAQLSTTADPFPVEISPNGVDPRVFAPDPAKAAPNTEFRILYVGRLHSQKNVTALVESAIGLCALPGPPVVLEIVGDGPERGALEKLFERSGATLALRWHGWLGKADVVTCYQRAHVVVNPAFYEAMPNTVLEAMACAVAVVASRVGGNEDLVIDGETGFLFDPAVPEQLSAALQRVRLDPALRRELGARGRDRVVESFSWSSVAAQNLRLLS
jgi:glycosyltransferase involved in cell wall biosynthesis